VATVRLIRWPQTAAGPGLCIRSSRHSMWDLRKKNPKKSLTGSPQGRVLNPPQLTAGILNARPLAVSEDLSGLGGGTEMGCQLPVDENEE